MDLAGFPFIIFIIHVGFAALCPNTASPVLQPAAIKQEDTPFPLRDRERGNEPSRGARRGGGGSAATLRNK